jgi:hypothetical protein
MAWSRHSSIATTATPVYTSAEFTLADCSATIRPEHRKAAYLDRLLARPARICVSREAEPYWQDFPGARRAGMATAPRVT